MHRREKNDFRKRARTLSLYSMVGVHEVFFLSALRKMFITITDLTYRSRVLWGHKYFF